MLQLPRTLNGIVAVLIVDFMHLTSVNLVEIATGNGDD
jgi:hypothetical protein